MSRNWRIFWVVITLLVMVTIFWFSSQGSKQSKNLSDSVARSLKVKQKTKKVRVSNQELFLGLSLRKLAHILLYAVLGFSACNAFTAVKGRIFFAGGISYAYAVFDEFHQTFSKRHGRWQDTLLDLIGIALGILIALLLTRLRQKIRERRTA